MDIDRYFEAIKLLEWIYFHIENRQGLRNNMSLLSRDERDKLKNFLEKVNKD